MTGTIDHPKYSVNFSTKKNVREILVKSLLLRQKEHRDIQEEHCVKTHLVIIVLLMIKNCM